jgi:spermidine/putrescine transport system ATP-binding protein
MCACPAARVHSARLPDGMRPAAGDDVSVVVRPEQAMLSEGGNAASGATVTNCVFFGTDTHIHVHLEDGTPFTLRRQNAGNPAPPAPWHRRWD